MSISNSFRTLKGYELANASRLTPALEDYLEMICRLFRKRGQVRISELAEMLNVKPSSASKMVKQLDGLGYVSAARYGNIALTNEGQAVGDYLLYRHNVVYGFLCLINGTRDELEEAEKIEHFLSPRTVANLDKFVMENKSRS